MTDRLLFMLSKVGSRLTSYFHRELKKEGIVLSPGQIGILLALEQEHETIMGRLAETLEIDNAAVSRLVDKLEKQLLAERRINTEDRRQILIRITYEGLVQAEIVKKLAKAANAKIKDGFTEDEIELFKRVNLGILQKFE